MSTEKILKTYLKGASLSMALWRSAEVILFRKSYLTNPILDLGCGNGLFSSFISNKIDVGADINKKALVKARERKIYKKLILADARKLPLPNLTFNTVLSNCVIEHIENPRAVFLEVNRLLKKNGRFVFTVPSEYFSDNLLIGRILRKAHLNYPARLYIKMVNQLLNHINIKTKEEWEKILLETGFKIKLFQYYMPRRTTYIFELFLPLRLLPSIINKLLPNNWVSRLAYLVKRQPIKGSGLFILAVKTKTYETRII